MPKPLSDSFQIQLRTNMYGEEEFYIDDSEQTTETVRDIKEDRQDSEGDAFKVSAITLPSDKQKTDAGGDGETGHIDAPAKTIYTATCTRYRQIIVTCWAVGACSS